MKRMVTILFVLIMLIGGLLYALVTFMEFYANRPPVGYPIVNKYEDDSGHYIDIRVPIDENSYIGYEIGDEYEVK